MTRRRLRLVASLLVAALAVCVVAACTSGRGASGSAASEAVPRPDAPPPSAAAAGGGTVATGTRGSTFGGEGTNTPSVTVTSPQLILTGSMSVRVAGHSIERAAARAQRIALAAGGRVDADDRTAAHTRRQHPTAELTLRVPNARVPGVLAALASLGRETSRQLSTRDVTTRVIDVASRVTSARAAIASLQKLYHRATKVGDVIRIESTLAQREAALEALEAQQNTLAAQTALATIDLNLTAHARGVGVPAPVASSGPGGILGGLEAGWHAFGTTVRGALTGLAAALPFVLVLLVLGLLVIAGYRRRRRARQPVSEG